MSYWKQMILAAYCLATHRSRTRAHRIAARNGTCPISVLFYHRVADYEPNRWTISCKEFQRQIEWLQQNCEIISLFEAQQRIANGVNRDRAVCLTFDDGYADNCLEALPLLVRQSIPFTYFVATNHIANAIPFPHDAAAGKPLPTNTIDQIKVLAQAGVELGAHTCNHVDLGGVEDHDQLYHEVVSCKRELESWTGQTIRYFAFPYGQKRNLSSQAARLAKEAGYLGVCSAYGGYNFPGDDPFHFQRIHGDPEFIRLRNWVTIDPRKLRIARAQLNQVAPIAQLLGETA